MLVTICTSNVTFERLTNADEFCGCNRKALQWCVSRHFIIGGHLLYREAPVITITVLWPPGPTHKRQDYTALSPHQ